MAHPQSGYSSTVSRSNWNLEMLVFVEGGKPEYPEKKARSRDENQQPASFNQQMYFLAFQTDTLLNDSL